MTPKKYDFRRQYKNTTFKGVQLTMTKTIEGVTTPFDLTGVDIKMQFKKTLNAQWVKEFTIGNGITVLDAVNGVFKIDKFIVTLPAESYNYDIRMTFPNGDVKVYMKGLFEVDPNVTDE